MVYSPLTRSSTLGNLQISTPSATRELSQKTPSNSRTGGLVPHTPLFQNRFKHFGPVCHQPIDTYIE